MKFEKWLVSPELTKLVLTNPSLFQLGELRAKIYYISYIKFKYPEDFKGINLI